MNRALFTMWSVLFGWVVVGAVVLLFISTAVGVLSMTPPHPTVAQVLYSIAAIMLLTRCAWWIASENNISWFRMLFFSFVIFGGLGVLWYVGFRWVGELRPAAIAGQTNTNTPAPSIPRQLPPAVEPPVIHPPPQPEKHLTPKETNKSPEPHMKNKTGDINIDKSTVSNTVLNTGKMGDVTINPPVNPNATVVTYDFDGVRREVSRGGSKFDTTVGEEHSFFNTRIQPLYASKDWATLESTCEEQIKKTPLWLTPYLYSGIALLNLGRTEQGVQRLRHVKNEAGGNSAYADAERILAQLGR